MAHIVASLALSAVLLLAAGCTTTRGEEGALGSEPVVPRVDMEPLGSSTVLGAGSVSLIHENGETQPIPVVLRQGPFRCTVERNLNGETQQRQWDLWLSELAAGETEGGYSWALWTRTPPREIKLFTPSPESNFLAWVHATDVEVADVSRPRDREAALRLWASGKLGPEVTRVPVRELLPEVDKWGVDAFAADIKLVSVSRDEAGNWAVIIASPEGKEFTIVGDGQNWEIAGDHTPAPQAP